MIKKNLHGDNMTQQLLHRMLILLVVFGVGASAMTARTKETAARKSKDDASGDVQRVHTSVFEQQRNTVSSIDFWTTNYGIFGFDVRNGRGGTFWPRGRGNQYIFAGGAWFAAEKRQPGTENYRRRVMITYNPNSGLSWMVPGTIEDGKAPITSDAGIQKYRTYFSPDFSVSDGTDRYNPTYPKWPIWDSSPNDTLRFNNYFGNYISDVGARTKSVSPKGPAFISQEDIFAVYKDTDLSQYEGGVARRQAEGFPLGFQIEQTMYSWGFGDYGDILFLKYNFIHPASFADTLKNCWMAAVMDVDIALQNNPIAGAQNDRARYYNEEDTLNLAVQWSNATAGEAGRGFGYLGFNFLESPAVDTNGYLRKDKRKFPVTEQLGLRTMRNWPITFDPLENEDRYQFMSSGQTDGDDGPGDRRLLMATGPFNMRPGDSARIVVGIILATTAGGGDATGTPEDMAELIRKVRFAQSVYNNNFIAPRPPDYSAIRAVPGSNVAFNFPPEGWLPLNNGIAFQWDSTSEMSVDTLERGLDFIGYRIFRARRLDQDTFSVDNTPNERRGPLGWKELARYEMASPFLKSNIIEPKESVPVDQFQIVDPIVSSTQRSVLVARNLSGALPWGPYFSNLLSQRTDQLVRGTNGQLDRRRFIKIDSIQFTTFEFAKDSLPLVQVENNPQNATDFGLNRNQETAARDSLVQLILAGKVKERPFVFNEAITFKNQAGGDSVVIVPSPWDETFEVRSGLIAEFMRRVTENRTFVDYGDDNRDGRVDYDANPEKSEKLINNIDYYYAVSAIDEGDYFLPSPRKLNGRIFGLPNVVKTTPGGARPGDRPSFTLNLDPTTANKLGGIYNVRLLVKDEQRFNQLFAGRTIEVEFYRLWGGYNWKQSVLTPPDPNAPDDGLYGTVFILRDSATRQTIGQFSSFLPPELCPTASVRGLPSYFTENSENWVGGDSVIYDTVRTQFGEIVRIDSVTFGLDVPNNFEKVTRRGSYTSDARCINQWAYGTLGLAFDYEIEQHGGRYRVLDSAEVISGPRDVYVGLSNQVDAATYKPDSLNLAPGYIDPYFTSGFVTLYEGSYNNGPGTYEIEFVDGGTERITTTFTADPTRPSDGGGAEVTRTFDVPFLNMKIRNVHSFERDQINPDGSITKVPVNYPFDLSPANVPFTFPPRNQTYPYVEMVPLGSYSSAAFGWRNTRSKAENGVSAVRTLAANRGNTTLNPLGSQNRYYQSRTVSTDGADTLDFVNVISIAGAQWTIDFTARGRRGAAATARAVPTVSATVTNYPQTDFKAGDKIRLFTAGGAFGYPFDGAKAYIRVEQYDPSQRGVDYTDDQLEQVQVVPNPYYVAHEGIRSAFEGQLYFHRLPPICTISIYTTNGDLVKQFTHDERTSTSPDKLAMDVWDLLSFNRQRIASQMLIAKIETPGGASVVRKFAIVVGPARISSEASE